MRSAMVLSSVSSDPPAMRPVGALIQLDAQSSFCEAYSSKCKPPAPCRSMASSDSFRSEEHTSELQSLMRISYAVFCLTNNIIHRQHPPPIQQSIWTKLSML